MKPRKFKVTLYLEAPAISTPEVVMRAVAFAITSSTPFKPLVGCNIRTLGTLPKAKPMLPSGSDR